MREEVSAHPEMMSEALQLLLRAQGEKDAFAWVHQILQAQNVAWEDLLQGLPEDVQDVVGDWCPERYVGVAQRLTVEEVDRIERLLELGQRLE